MASLKQFLKKAPTGESTMGMTGVESEWLELAKFELRGTRFLVSDAGHMGSEADGVSVAAAPGKYEVQVKVMEFGADRRISRLRAKLAGVEITESKEAGETWADVGRVGFSDGDALMKLGNALEEDELIDPLNEALAENEELFGTHRFGRGGPTMIYVDSGFGDGRFPVFELKSKGAAAGVEVEFIGKGETYPFNDRPSVGAAGAETFELLDPAMEAIGKLLGEMKDERTGDKEKDRGKFMELLERQRQVIHGQIGKEMAEYRRGRTELRREMKPWKDSIEPELAEGVASQDRKKREQVYPVIDQALFAWPQTLGKHCPMEVSSADVVENLVIVFEGATPGELTAEWWCATGDFSVREADFAMGGAIEAFRRVNEAKGSPLKFVCRKQEGLRAEYFLPRQ